MSYLFVSVWFSLALYLNEHALSWHPFWDGAHMPLKMPKGPRDGPRCFVLEEISRPFFPWLRRWVTTGSYKGAVSELVTRGNQRVFYVGKSNAMKYCTSKVPSNNFY